MMLNLSRYWSEKARSIYGCNTPRGRSSSGGSRDIAISFSGSVIDDKTLKPNSEGSHDVSAAKVTITIGVHGDISVRKQRTLTIR